MGAEARLKEKNITLPRPATPVANYVGAVRAGNLLFVSGHGPLRADGKPSAELTIPSTLTTRLTRSRLPRLARTVASRESPISRAT